MKRIVVFVMLIAALMLAACGQAAPKAPEACNAELGCAAIAKDQTIKIGFAGPMTGDYSQFGIDMSNAMKIAVADLGNIEGWKVEMAIEDDGGGAEGGAAVANKLVSDPTFVAMAGHAFSGATAAAMPIYEKAGIPMMSPSATNPDLTTKGSTVFNRNAFTDTDQGLGAAKYLFETLGIKKLALMHDGTDYGQGLANVVKEQFESLGGETVAFEGITPGESDYSAPLAAVASAKPEGLYFGGYNAEAAVLVNQMEQAGLSGVVFFSDDGIYGKDFLSKVGDKGEGVYAATLVPPGTDAILKFNKAYLDAYGTEAGVLSPYTWNSYDAVIALIAAIKSVAIVEGDTMYIPRGALVKAVRATKGFQGISGVITCQETGECNASGPVFYIVKDGAWVPAE
ncbi:MAG TPA: branched-chain amino acid ABC transporter substrate-binding protein [Anaerolineales bacterium]|nr:branched-chain amino acid ABC transporter substrate-binding protein [Anaerolineales bacterium]